MVKSAAFLFVGISVMGCHSQSATPQLIRAKDCGVIGDGKTDDGPAIRRAVDAAIKAGPGTTLVFEKKTYRLGPSEGGNGQIRLVGVDGLTIDGKGATLLLHPQNGMFDVIKCKNVTIRGFRIDFDPLPFTQGTIRTVVPEEGYFDLALHEGYPLPLPDAQVKKRLGKGGWHWGTVMDPKERHRRWGIGDHYFIEAVTPVAERVYRIKVTPQYARSLKPVRSGDRFFLPLHLTQKGERAFGSNILIHQSADCTIEDVTIYSARCGMNYALTRNEGKITLRNNKITFKPETTRICTTWKDGMHCKDNRVGPLIEGCYFEGMLDDSINISANTAMATKVISSTEFQLKGPAFSKGDRVMIFDPRSGKIRETKVVAAEARGRSHIVKLADAIDGVITGHKQREDIKSTHFYNMSYANDGFVVRNCTFKPQRRHALLVRSCNGIFEGNTVDSVGGAAVWMGNEMGSFYEGPFPQNNIIRNNTIRNTQLPAIHIYTTTLGGKVRYTKGIRVENNAITVLPGKPGISIRAAQDIVLKDNRIVNQQGKDVGKSGIDVKNSSNVEVK